MISLKEFILRESKNVYLDSLIKLVDKIKEDKKEDTEKEYAEELGEKLLVAVKKLINVAVKEDVYVESKELIKDIEEILKDAKISDKLVDLYFEAGLEPSKREKFEAKIRSEVADTKVSGKSAKEEKETDDSETDEDIKKKAKANAKDDDEFEKEVAKEIENEKKSKKVKKILIGLVDKENEDGEVTQGTLLDTDLPAKKIEDFEDAQDVWNAGVSARKLTTIAQIAKRIKELGGTSVYWFKFDDKNENGDYFKIVKV